MKELSLRRRCDFWTDVWIVQIVQNLYVYKVWEIWEGISWRKRDFEFSEGGSRDSAVKLFYKNAPFAGDLQPSKTCLAQLTSRQLLVWKFASWILPSEWALYSVVQTTISSFQLEKLWDPDVHSRCLTLSRKPNKFYERIFHTCWMHKRDFWFQELTNSINFTDEFAIHLDEVSLAASTVNFHGNMSKTRLFEVLALLEFNFAEYICMPVTRSHAREQERAPIDRNVTIKEDLRIYLPPVRGSLGPKLLNFIYL